MNSKYPRIGRYIQTYNVLHDDDRVALQQQLLHFFTEMKRIAGQWEGVKKVEPASLAQIDEQLFELFGLSSQAVRRLYQWEKMKAWSRTTVIEVVEAVSTLHLRALADQPIEDAPEFQSLSQFDAEIGFYLSVSGSPAAREVKPFDHTGWNRVLTGPSAGVRIVSAAEAPPACSAPAFELTRSQKILEQRLQEFWELKITGRRVAGYDPRAIPLIVAPSGSGKTALVQHFAGTGKLPMKDFNVATWIISGAKSDPITLAEIGRFVREADRGILFIDEVDKLFGTSDWSRSVQQEVFALLDGRTDSFGGWDEEMRAKFECNFMIVGAGTWQNLYGKNRRTLGFKETEAGDWSIDLNAQDVIPDELLMRFNADILYLKPLSVEEFSDRIGKIVHEIGLPALSPERQQVLAEQAYASGRHNRWLEAYASRMLRKQARRTFDS